jgi:hypothetical protein
MTTCHIGPRSLGATLRPYQSFIALEVFGLPAMDLENGKKVFGFHRHKNRRSKTWGFDVWLWVDGSGMNLTAHGLSPFHRRLDDARQWAIDFAKAHGFTAMQRGKRPRRQRPPTLTLVKGGGT